MSDVNPKTNSGFSRRALLRAGAAVTVATTAACDSSETTFNGVKLSLPMLVGKQVAYLDSNEGAVFFVDPTSPSLIPKVVAVGQRPSLSMPRPGRDELLVLCRGEPVREGMRATAPTLRLVSPAGVKEFPLGSRFDSLALSEDGRFAIAHFSANAGSARTDLLFNPNELAVIDLDGAGAAAVTARTVRSFGGIPDRFIFSPSLNLPDGPRRLVVVLSSGYVTLLDLNNPKRSEISVPLAPPGTLRNYSPQQVLFDNSDSEPWVLVRAQGSNDIFALRLVANPADQRNENSNDFKPVLSLLGAGNGPADMVLFDAGGKPRLLVVSTASADAHVIDPRTARVTRIPLEAAASVIVPFLGTSPQQPGKTAPRTLLLGAGNGVASATFLDLENLEEQRQRNRELVAVGTGSTVLPLADQGKVILGDRGNLRIIDLSRRTVAPIGGRPLGEVKVSPPPSEKLWVSPGQNDGRGAVAVARVAFLSLVDLTSREVTLDLPAQSLVPLKGRDDRNYVLVDHPGLGGAFTVLNGDVPDRKTARSLIGFTAQALFERGGK